MIYTSDHGDNLGARGLWGKSNMYEESAGVPMMMAGPEIPAGFVCREPVSLVDGFPTILDCVGVPRNPADADLPGDSLFDVMRGQTGPRSRHSANITRPARSPAPSWSARAVQGRALCRHAGRSCSIWTPIHGRRAISAANLATRRAPRVRERTATRSAIPTRSIGRRARPGGTHRCIRRSRGDHRARDLRPFAGARGGRRSIPPERTEQSNPVPLKPPGLHRRTRHAPKTAAPAAKAAPKKGKKELTPDEKRRQSNLKLPIEGGKQAPAKVAAVGKKPAPSGRVTRKSA